jgi:hypothetical protein
MGLLVILACAIMAPLPGCWRICQRAGFPGWMSLLIVIPVVNAVAVFLLVRSRSGQFSAMPPAILRTHREQVVSR